VVLAGMVNLSLSQQRGALRRQTTGVGEERFNRLCQKSSDPHCGPGQALRRAPDQGKSVVSARERSTSELRADLARFSAELLAKPAAAAAEAAATAAKSAAPAELPLSAPLPRAEVVVQLAKIRAAAG
jgi:hypothetical protein